MSLDLPKPIAAYLAAVNAKDAEILSLCFAEEAVVHDEPIYFPHLCSHPHYLLSQT